MPASSSRRINSVLANYEKTIRKNNESGVQSKMYLSNLAANPRAGLLMKRSSSRRLMMPLSVVEEKSDAHFSVNTVSTTESSAFDPFADAPLGDWEWKNDDGDSSSFNGSGTFDFGEEDFDDINWNTEGSMASHTSRRSQSSKRSSASGPVTNKDDRDRRRRRRQQVPSGSVSSRRQARHMVNSLNSALETSTSSLEKSPPTLQDDKDDVQCRTAGLRRHRSFRGADGIDGSQHSTSSGTSRSKRSFKPRSFPVSKKETQVPTASCSRRTIAPVEVQDGTNLRNGELLHSREECSSRRSRFPRDPTSQTETNSSAGHRDRT
jgi:hypothetical protein